MRILFVNQRAYLPQLLGGIEQTTFELGRQLARMGHETAIMCGIEKYDALWLRNRIVSRLSGRAFPADRYRGSLVYRGYDTRRNFDEVVADFRPDAVVTNGGNMDAFEQAAVVARRHIPAAYYCHDVTTLLALKSPALLEGVVLIANSDYTAGRVAEILGRPATVIQPLVDREAYRTVSSRRVVMMVNPRRSKGGQTAFELARACPDIPFLFVEAWARDDPFVSELRMAARKVPNVRWLRPTTDMRKLYGQTRILLVPSEREDETWGRVVSEAHLSGIPVLASTAGALPESVGTGGILVDLGAPLERWLAALRSLWDDTALYAQLSARALESSERPELRADSQGERLIALLCAR
jgi:glycosyltransferase involved in cell wall biosynthesis